MRAQRLIGRAHGSFPASGPVSGASQHRISSPPSQCESVPGTRKVGSALLLCIALGACASNPLPPPNSVRATYDRGANAIQVYVSDAQMPRGAWLVDADGPRYPLILTPVSGPHINYSSPPTIGLGLGGFGWDGGGGAGGGAGIGFPLGRPHPTSVDDQFVASSRLVPPADYGQRWSQYRVVVDLGTQALEVPAPSPGRS